MSIPTRIFEKSGIIGAVIGSFSCAMCFPATASLGAAIGVGFLSQWEGLFVHWLIPIFAAVALIANLAGWFSHHQWQRTLAGSVGPSIALVGVLGMPQHFLPTNLARAAFYTGLILMVIVSIWDMVRPAHRRCTTEVCDTPRRPLRILPAKTDVAQRRPANSGVRQRLSRKPFASPA